MGTPNGPWGQNGTPQGGYPGQQQQGWYPGGNQQPGRQGYPPQPGHGQQPTFGQHPGPARQPGAPQQPAFGQQPTFGQWPGSGRFPQQQVPPGPPKKRGPWLWLIPVLVVVVAAAIVVPILLTRGGGSSANAQGSGSAQRSGGSAPTKPLASWQVNAGQMTPYTQGLGVRLDGDDLISVTDTSVTAFARDTGAPQWTVTPPGSGNGFCALSRNVVDHQLAVGFGQVTSTGTVCTGTGVLNLEKHSFTWQQQVPAFTSSEGTFDDASGESLVFAGDYLYAGAKSSIVRMSVSDGTVQSLGSGFQAGQDTCMVNDMAADAATVYVIGNCLGDKEYLALLELDVKTGSLGKSTMLQAGDIKFPSGAEVDEGEFVSLNPLILFTSGLNSTDDGGIDSFVRLDSSLKPSWTAAEQLGDQNTPYTALVKLDVRTGKVLSKKTQRNKITDIVNNVTMPIEEPLEDVAWALADGRAYGLEQEKLLTPQGVLVISLG